MFRHKGTRRTYLHNLRLASLLSLVAGIVDIAGVLSVKTLTTNVTGHFAYFVEELVLNSYTSSVIFLLFIGCFLFGSFISNYFVELMLYKRVENPYAIPMITEIVILLFIGLVYDFNLLSKADGICISCALLLAMGIQNSFVTRVSRSVVRTTHLTGLFTDLGIELSQLFFYKRADKQRRLYKSIYLKLAIILCFFLGCLIGGISFGFLQLKTLLIAALVLVVAFFYDNIRYHLYNYRRKLQYR